jgi:hypothetical protein
MVCMVEMVDMIGIDCILLVTYMFDIELFFVVETFCKIAVVYTFGMIRHYCRCERYISVYHMAWNRNTMDHIYGTYMIGRAYLTVANMGDIVTHLI